MSERLGPFEVLEEQLGSGATRIWRCAGEDGGTVVVEQLLPPLSRSQRFTEAVLEAARACEGVDHGNLAPVIWTQPIDGVPTLAEGRVPGHDVRAIYNQAFRRRASLPVAFSTQVVADAALGFGAAGRAHALNRGGVAPQNIWVARAGYGVAIHVARASLINRAFFARPDGPLQGSYTYASPEQIHGRAATARTDVFGLGIVLYEMTTGARLFKRRSAEEARSAVLACEVQTPSKLLPGYPPALERIVLKALRRQPSERWETPEQMARALEREVLDRMADPRTAVRRFVEQLYPSSEESPPRGSRGPRGSDRPAVRIVPRPSAEASSAKGPEGPIAPPPPAQALPMPPSPPGPLGPEAVVQPASDPGTLDAQAATVARAVDPIEAEAPTEIRPASGEASEEDGEAPTQIRSLEAPSEPPEAPPEPPPPLWTDEELEPASRSRRGVWILASLVVLAAGLGVWQSRTLSVLAPVPTESEPSAAPVSSPTEPVAEPPPKAESKPPAPVIQGPPGRLELWVEPWAEVRLNDRDLGLTPLPDTEVPAGAHQLVIVNKELNLEWKGKVDVKPGTTTRLRVDLREPSARSLSYEPVADESGGRAPGG